MPVDLLFDIEYEVEDRCGGSHAEEVQKLVIYWQGMGKIGEPEECQ